MAINTVGNGDQLGALIHQRRLDFKTLASAIDAGNTQAAKAALTSVQKDNQTLTAAGGKPKGSEAFQARINADFTALAGAVQSGNMTQAQSALNTLRTDAAPPHHERHHEHDDATSQSGEASSFGKDMASLIKAVQSGNTSAAASSANAVVQDLQSLLEPDAPSSQHHDHHHVADATSAASNGNSNGNSSANAESAIISQVLKQLAHAFQQTSSTG